MDGIKTYNLDNLIVKQESSIWVTIITSSLDP